jgi:hypothetical protein
MNVWQVEQVLTSLALKLATTDPAAAHSLSRWRRPLLHLVERAIHAEREACAQIAQRAGAATTAAEIRARR